MATQTVGLRIDDRKFRKSRFRKDPLSTGASNIITCAGKGGGLLGARRRAPCSTATCAVAAAVGRPGGVALSTTTTRSRPPSRRAPTVRCSGGGVCQ
eukprot:scaffold103415_cov32-Phaeocystis_antarctica.AAC.1